MSSTVRTSTASSAATIRAATSPIPSEIAQSVFPDTASVVICPPPPFERARRVENPHAGVVDPGDAGELVGLGAHDLHSLDGAAACAAIRRASVTTVITIAAATRMTTIPSTSPMHQPVDAAVTDGHLSAPPSRPGAPR